MFNASRQAGVLAPQGTNILGLFREVKCNINRHRPLRAIEISPPQGTHKILQD